MSSPASIQSKGCMIPCLRYRDAPAAIDWLCTAFGFEKQAVYPQPDGSIAHAQLTWGRGMVMLGSAPKTSAIGAKETNEYGALIKQPAEVGGANTQSIYVVVPDADDVLARAQAAGAEIVIAIKDEDYGGRGFTCRDLEGHVWSFGTYDPW
ncbi:MAG: hypothetical protein JWP52_1474 [Rhizobacter sp.]|nr:hypothetical protein [Rhizobacter sp.]